MQWMFVFYTCALILSIFCLIIVMKQQPGQDQKLMQMITFLIFIIALGYWFKIQATSIDGLMNSYKLIYIGVFNIYYFIFLFCIRYCNFRIKNWIVNVLGGISVIQTVLVFLIEKNKMFFKSYAYEKKNRMVVLNKEYGIVYEAFIVTIILYCLAIIACSIIYRVKNKRKSRRHPFVLIIVAFIPILSYVCEELTKTYYDLFMFGIMILMMILMYLVYMGKEYNLYQKATRYVFSSMQDGIIVIDTDRNYCGSNDKAKYLFEEMKEYSYGDSINKIDKIRNVLSGDRRDYLKDDNIYQVELSEIQNEGYVIMFKNVTKERKHMKFMENYQSLLEDEVTRKTNVLKSIQEQIIRSLAEIIDSRDHVTGGHVKRTSHYVNIIVDNLRNGSEFKEFKDKSYADYVSLAAPLHDIGKIAIPDSILNKEGPLNREEFEIMKSHAKVGGDLIKRTLGNLEDQKYYKLSFEVANYHHERWDGEGYPEGISGEKIPLSARIMAVADVFDALTSKRSYKDGYDAQTAFELIIEGKGTQFDPAIVDAFLKSEKEIEEYVNMNNR